jgi:hypothetical protein
LILLTAGLAPGLAEQRRVALVVGNSAYEATSALPNPANDARLFADLLTSQGFEVETLVDVGRAAFAQGLARFEKRIEPGDIALFYYAGHGMQMRGENYLIGVDARLQSEFDVDAEAVSLNSVVGLMERRTSIVLVFIDACRNNPLAERLALADGATRSAPPRGLAPIDSTGSGTMVAFAALPGQVAYDGVERNSPFTSSLVEHLATPDLEIGTAFKRVIRDVREKTGGRQSPQIVSNLSAELYLGIGGAGHTISAPAAPAPEAADQPADQPTDQLAMARVVPPAKPAAPAPLPIEPKPLDAEAATTFAKAEKIGSARAWRLFLERHGDSQLAARALQRLRQADTQFSPQQQELALALSQGGRERVQQRLVELGLDPGTPDGDFGARTRRELAKFQRSAGLSPSGFADQATLRQLDLGDLAADPSAPSEAGWSAALPASALPPSGRTAMMFAPGDLKGLETDPRVIAAAKCLDGEDIIYGGFEAHLYVAVRADGDADWHAAEAAATRCGAYLVAIGSKAENDFVYDLFAADPGYFASGTETDGSWRTGPWIGLRQDPGGREPRGGWRWGNGEPLEFANWGSGLPDEWTQGQDSASFFSWRDQPNFDMSAIRSDAWDDTSPDDELNGFVLEFD